MKKLLATVALIATATTATAGSVSCHLNTDGDMICAGENISPEAVTVADLQARIAELESIAKAQEDRIADLLGEILKLEKQSKQKVNTSTDMDSCTQISEIAKMIMEARQRGVPMSSVLNMNKQNGWELVDYLVIEAYESMLFYDSGYKQEAITEFQNKAHLDCIKLQ